MRKQTLKTLINNVVVFKKINLAKYLVLGSISLISDVELQTVYLKVTRSSLYNFTHKKNAYKVEKGNVNGNKYKQTNKPESFLFLKL